MVHSTKSQKTNAVSSAEVVYNADAVKPFSTHADVKALVDASID